MRRSVLQTLLFLQLPLSACAGPASNIPPGEARERRHFDGQPFTLDLIDGLAKERGPSSGLIGYAGRVTGVICGTDLEVSASYAGDHVEVSGFVENQYPMKIEVRELGAEPGVKGYLRFTGSIAYHTVQLDLFGDRLMGWVGHCRYDMRLHTDLETRQGELLQTVNARGNSVRMRLGAAEQIWGLPTPVQAVTLPMLIKCLEAQVFARLGQEPPPMSFAGPASAVPRQTLSFVSRGNLCR